MTQIWGVKSGFYIHVSTIYPCYFFLGYALTKNMVHLSNKNAGIITVIGIIGVITATVAKINYHIENIEMLYGYSSIFVIFMAAGFFWYIKNLKINTKSKLWKCIECIDECSFGIYIIHMVFVRLVLRYWQVNPYDGNSGAKFTGLFLIIFIVSFGITWCLKKIPCIKKIL